MNKQEIKINNCPHCDNKCELKETSNSYYYIQCENCGCGVFYSDKDILIDMWNDK